MSEPYDPNIRLAVPDDEDVETISSIEMTFAIPVYVTQGQMDQLRAVMTAIIASPCNTPKEGVHWLCSEGSKPKWSQTDARFLNKSIDPSAPIDGEPEYDHSIHMLESSARGFLSNEERERKKSR